MGKKRIVSVSKQKSSGEKDCVEAPGIDPGTSRMLSERSTIWATPPFLSIGLVDLVYILFVLSNTEH